MAKFGIALGSGPRGLGFESRHSDQQKTVFSIWKTRFFSLSKNFERVPFERKQGFFDKLKALKLNEFQGFFVCNRVSHPLITGNRDTGTRVGLGDTVDS